MANERICEVCGEVHEVLSGDDLELHRLMWNLHISLVGMIERTKTLQAKADEQAIRIGRLAGK